MGYQTVRQSIFPPVEKPSAKSEFFVKARFANRALYASLYTSLAQHSSIVILVIGAVLIYGRADLFLATACYTYGIIE
ncbi:MAG: hypothetical protein FWH15_03170 [Betaproteobacteria bacterium]|nr:hypothetical protein [Betaproteobacteria bacterium]